MINPKIYNLILLAFALSPLLLVISCSKEDEVEATFSSLWDNRFSSCGTVCHTAGDEDTENGPNLSTKSGFYSNLVNKTVNDNYPNWINDRASDCNDAKFIAPGDSNNSSMAASLINSKSVALAAAQNCTTALNVHALKFVTLTDVELANAIVKWIDDGAPNN